MGANHVTKRENRNNNNKANESRTFDFISAFEQFNKIFYPKLPRNNYILPHAIDVCMYMVLKLPEKPDIFRLNEELL